MSVIRTFVAAATLSALLPAHAVVLTQWSFEGAVTPATGTSIGPIAPSTGSGQGSGSHTSASTAWSAPAGNGSSNSLSSNNWAVGDYLQFVFPTLGASDLSISFDQTSSGTGPRDFRLDWSTNGTSFSTFAIYSVLVNGAPNTAWTSSTYNPAFTFSFDLSPMTNLNNQAQVWIRLVDNSTTSANGGTVASGGTSRLDNFTVNTSPVPETSTGLMLLAGLVATGFLARRRG